MGLGLRPSRKVQVLSGHFRILKGWHIGYKRATKDLSACVTIHPKRRKAFVRGYGGKRVPKDYYLHEILHCALREFSRKDGRKAREMRKVEEELVQDICAILTR